MTKMIPLSSPWSVVYDLLKVAAAFVIMSLPFMWLVFFSLGLSVIGGCSIPINTSLLPASSGHRLTQPDRAPMGGWGITTVENSK